MKSLKIPKMGNQKEEGQTTQYIVLQLPNEKKTKGTNNDQQTITQRTKQLGTWTPLKRGWTNLILKYVINDIKDRFCDVHYD